MVAERTVRRVRTTTPATWTTALTSIERPDELLTLDELCAMLKISKDTAYKQRATGTGPPGYRIGKHLRFKRSDVLAWLETKKDRV